MGKNSFDSDYRDKIIAACWEAILESTRVNSNYGESNTIKPLEISDALLSIQAKVLSISENAKDDGMVNDLGKQFGSELIKRIMFARSTRSD